mgnify:CR=1 FL=1
MESRCFRFSISEEIDTSEKVARWISGTTSIGDEGKYTVELSELGRILVFNLPDKGFPPQLGTPIVTTRKPWKERVVSVDEMAEKVIHGESCCRFSGLDKKVFRGSCSN